MTRRDFIRTAGCSVAAGTLLRSAVDRKPNIIFILAEELGIANVSCYGADLFKTPNIDALALGGARYTHCYTAPLCGPSYALILTGRYAFRTGVTNQDATVHLDPSEETFTPAYLKPAGYVTAMAGKWGPLPLKPAAFGFDEHIEATNPDASHAFVSDFLNRHRADSFYLYYSMSNLQKPKSATPDSRPESTDFYTDNIVYLDKMVGKLVAELERLKLRENTLIVFTGDNGTGGVYADESTIGGRRLAGEKGSMLEGGALVPLIVNWPGKTPAGKVSGELVDSTDFLPTFAELAGVRLAADKTLDGHSFAPQVLGQKGRTRDWVFIELGRNWYVRDAGWKLNQAGRLFDMSKAPFEESLVPAESTNADAMAARKRLEAILDELNPGGGILDEGDGSGRHKGRLPHTKKQKKAV